MSEPLPDYIAPSLDVLLVGINPGVRSAEKGHHFAGPGNRFWSLLADAGLTPRKLSFDEDDTLPSYGIGLTNIVARASRSSSELNASDYATGRRLLAKKIERFRPKAVGFVGVTVFREYWPELSIEKTPKKIACGKRPETIGGARVFVLPNPSGRNAHYSYDAMLSFWCEMRDGLRDDA